LSATLPAELTTLLFREIIVSIMRREGQALTTHQLAVYLTCYTIDRDHTVRGLAADLGVSKSVITRALDKLSSLDLARRRPDPMDRRSVVVEHTEAGRQLIADINAIASRADRAGSLAAAAN
jgi:DNA-binding MarR family transcriptional regulator